MIQTAKTEKILLLRDQAIQIQRQATQIKEETADPMRLETIPKAIKAKMTIPTTMSLKTTALIMMKIQIQQNLI